jgi:hypothetical protein
MKNNMANFTYIDESGDLGRSIRSSRYLVITAITTDNNRRLDKIVRKVWTSKQHKKDAGELHAIEATDSVRIKLLSLLDELNISITYTLIDKVKFSGNLQQAYYRAIAKQVAMHYSSQVFVVDKRDTNKKRTHILRTLGFEEIFTRVEFADSKSVRQLQAVDFVSWSIFQSIEHGNYKYIEIIQRRLHRNILFK